MKFKTKKGDSVKLKIKKGDSVYISTGKDKGKSGVVEKVIKEKSKVIIAGLNCVWCFEKNKGRFQKSMPLHISNVMHIDPSDSKPTRVKVLIKDGAKLLVSKRTDSVIRKISEVKNNAE